MNPAIPFLAPLLLLPVAGAVDTGAEDDAAYVADSAAEDSSAIARVLPLSNKKFRDDPAHQVRIEEHITIRIVPRGARSETNLLFALPNRASAPRITERKIGRCLAVAGIAGVQPNEGGQLILFMRNRRVVSGMLERACRARDFYSGFYLAPNGDGKLCVNRDMLLSRNGANCKLTQIRELIPDD